jgi:hypothetical protein
MNLYFFQDILHVDRTPLKWPRVYHRGWFCTTGKFVFSLLSRWQCFIDESDIVAFYFDFPLLFPDLGCKNYPLLRFLQSAYDKELESLQTTDLDISMERIRKSIRPEAEQDMRGAHAFVADLH